MDSCPCGKDRYPWIHVCFLLQAGIGGSERCCHHPGPVKRFRYGLDPLFLGACLLYALNRWGLKPQTSLSFFHDHFNDILLIPAALPLVLWVQRLLGLRRHDEAPTRREIVGHLIVWSLLSEAVLPFFCPARPATSWMWRPTPRGPSWREVGGWFPMAGRALIGSRLFTGGWSFSVPAT